MKRTIAGLILLASMAGMISCASTPAVYSSAALDLTTTRIALNAGCREMNPALRSTAAAVVLQGLTAYLTVRYAQHLKAKGVKNWQLPLRIFSAVHFGAAGWNATQLMRARQ
jgi:hypothetical protein